VCRRLSRLYLYARFEHQLKPNPGLYRESAWGLTAPGFSMPIPPPSATTGSLLVWENGDQVWSNELILWTELEHI
jgi:hypothetical protein